MRVRRGLESYPASARASVASIGNYDGVHLGHRAILSGVLEAAARRGAGSLLVTFDPHPAAVLAPERAPRSIDTREQQLERLEEIGLDEVLIVHFDHALAALDGRTFVARLLAAGVTLAEVHVGQNFRFGHARHGDLALLSEIGAEHGFDVSGVAPVRLDGVVISSTEIRRLLGAGDVARAAAMLGRAYEIVGDVQAGDGRGRQLGCPTANVAVLNDELIQEGVYVTETVARGRSWPSMTNVGRRPTVGGGERRVETHLLGFEGDLYGERLTLRFLARLRDERRFAGLPELAEQLERDRTAAEAFFRDRPLSPA